MPFGFIDVYKSKGKNSERKLKQEKSCKDAMNMKTMKIEKKRRKRKKRVKRGSFQDFGALVNVRQSIKISIRRKLTRIIITHRPKSINHDPNKILNPEKNF